MITVAEAKEFRGISKADDPVMLSAVAAVNYYVDSLPNIDLNSDGTWAETTHYAALLLFGKWYNRQYSITAVTAYGDSGPQFVAKYDPDISRMLHIDGFEVPVVY